VSLPTLAERGPAGDAPLVSVICATYNQRPFLAQCLDSVLAQRTRFAVEVIVHDDASTDGTAALAQDYVQRHSGLVRAVLQPAHRFGPTHKVRIELLDHARGDFIAVCDGDDFWRDPDKLERQARHLLGHTDQVLCYHDADRVGPEGEVLPHRIRERKSNRDYSAAELRVFACDWIPLATVMHRRVPLDHPPEFHLAPNSDNFLPVLLAEFGGAGYLAGIAPSAVRTHPGAAFKMLPSADRAAMHLQTHLQIAAYLLRRGEREHARVMLRTRVPSATKAFLTRLG
jgi:glycosyltransferase involved in cell wall biosynthesis